MTRLKSLKSNVKEIKIEGDLLMPLQQILTQEGLHIYLNKGLQFTVSLPEL